MKNLKIFTKNIDEEALKQINELLDQDAFKDSKVRIMPDVHAGKGCVIGFTGNLGNKVIPNIVGVDIGCGLLCIELGNVELDLEKIDNIIRKYVPSGRNVHEKLQSKFVDLEKLYCLKELKNNNYFLERSLGTLGSGNHFIEIDKDEDNNKYLVIHTGSRNLGKQVASIYQEKAIKYCSYKKEMQEEKEKIKLEYKKQGRKSEITAALIDVEKKYEGKTKLPIDLCYLEGENREKYLHDMKICQEFARNNRLCIAKQILFNYFNIDNLDNNFKYFETIHNYISFEDNIIRKGAIAARSNERVLIPMNMRDGCIIGIGKGNDDWNKSAPHGAGRIMSRNKAKEVVNIDEYRKSMNGIYTTSVNKDTIDEAPMVYKPMQEIVDCIKDTVEIEKIIKPIYNFKASE